MATKQGSNASRPQLSSSMRSSSYLTEHQQYVPPRQLETHLGIDAVVEDAGSSHGSPPPPAARAIMPFAGIPSAEQPPKIVDSGVTHGFSHPNCAPPAGQRTDRLIATLIYKGRDRSRANGSISRSRSPAQPRSPDSSDSLPANMAPTTSLEDFPLEPPTQESEQQLDHLYGSYISPLCITSFLHLMSTFPMPKDADEPYSSHRCLDSQENPLVVELALSPTPSPAYLSLRDLRKHELIYRFEQEWNVDVALQRDTVSRRYPRLVVFDMDSTLITQEVIDLLAHSKPDLTQKVSEITNRAMHGEIEFEQAFRDRVALLKDVPASIFDELRSVLEVTNGTRELIRALKRMGAKTAVLSGGFLPLTRWLATELGMDYAYANEVEIEDGKLTGKVKGTIVGQQRKHDLLVEIAAKEKIDLSQVVAVGDGANDLLMLGRAGLGVAWNAKPRVQMEAAARLNGERLSDLLYLFGVTAEEIEVFTA